MANRRWIVAMVIAIMSLAWLGAQAPQDDDSVWKAFMTWFKAAPAVRGNPVAAYTAVLQKAGTPEGEVKRQAGVLMRQIMSAEALKSAHANASKAGVRIDAVKSSYADFDFGTAKWDLIVLTFAWSPMTDPAFVDRLRTSLRPNGCIVFEHFVEASDQPRPPAMQALKLGQLRELLKGFRLDRYEEVTGLADWAGPDTPMVRAVAVKL